MKFTLSNPADGASALAGVLTDSLRAEEKVLWLVSGGSNITIARAALAAIPLDDRRRLTVGLVDERFGPIGHENSNFKQLADAGFDPSPGVFLPIIRPDLSRQDCRQAYESTLAGLFDDCNVVICQLGIGRDGHTAGILPGSAAVTTGGLVTDYDGPDFERISLTFDGLRRATATLVFAFGQDKRRPLENLRDNLSLSEQPAQILKQLSDVRIYNDVIKGET